MRDKETNPTISLEVSYTRLEKIGIAIQDMSRSTPPRSRSVGVGDAKTGMKLLECSGWKPLGHNVGKLLGGRYMKNTKLTQLYLLADEVNIKLINMLGALVLHRIGREIGGRNIITKNHRSFRDWNPKFTK